ncbi:MAG: hypothetical protein Fues2KO_48460 [Fuerstiella sp.]
MLELRNPHSVLAVLDVRPRAVRSVQVSSEKTGTPWDDVAEAARSVGVAVSASGSRSGHQRGQKQGRGGGRRRETERTGAGSAMVEPPSPVPINNLWKPASETSNGIWLALDQVQDPQNLGAIFRLAGFFGVRGIILTKDKSAPVNATVCDVAVGGVEYVPHCIVPNLVQAFQKAQKHDVWVLGTSEHSSTSLRQIKSDRNWLLVMGNEGTGLRRLTQDSCDQLVGLPPLGKVTSLNVAAATAACLTVLTAEAS